MFLGGITIDAISIIADGSIDYKATTQLVISGID